MHRLLGRAELNHFTVSWVGINIVIQIRVISLLLGLVLGSVAQAGRVRHRGRITERVRDRIRVRVRVRVRVRIRVRCSWSRFAASNLAGLTTKLRVDSKLRHSLGSCKKTRSHKVVCSEDAG